MEGLQRSAISFRRQGSSGLVWDDKLISQQLNNNNNNNDNKPSLEQDQQAGSGASDQKPELRRTRSDGGARRNYHSVKVEQAEDPPSPRLSGCGFCSAFSRTNNAVKTSKKTSGNANKHK